MVPPERDGTHPGSRQPRESMRAVHVTGRRVTDYDRRGQPDDLLAGKPAELVELVHAHVDEDPAAVRPERRRRWRLVPLLAAHQVDRAELAAQQLLAQRLKGGHVPAP